MWSKVFNSQNDQALITLTGIDFATFEDLLTRGFKHYYKEYTPFTEDGTIWKLDKTVPQGRP
jgi:hypothetical protein